MINQNLFYLLIGLALIKQSISISKRSAVVSRYTPKRALWTKYDLTFSLLGSVSDKNQTSFQSVRLTLADAFHDWQSNSCFSFTDVTPSLQADIKVIFTNDKSGHLNCNRKFRGTAAHAYFRYHKKFPANIHVNNEIFWMESKYPSGSISLKTVILHEIGHVLGLYHSDDKNSVMYESIFTNVIKNVTLEDRNALLYIYKTYCQKIIK